MVKHWKCKKNILWHNFEVKVALSIIVVRLCVYFLAIYISVMCFGSIMSVYK